MIQWKLLGATVVPVTSGSKTLKDSLNEAMRDWVTNIDNTFYIIGTVAGPHPYPWNKPIAFEPPPTQAISASGKPPTCSANCVFASLPITLWKSRTIIG
jgi:hypothetical protein